jgi:Fe-S-cluster-containing hydrogenase component 2
MIKLMKSNQVVRDGIDWIFIVRELQRHFAPHADPRELRALAGRVLVRKFEAGQVVYAEGSIANSLFILRSGNVRLSRRRGDADVLVAQLRTGQLVGELGLMGDSQRRETATAMLASELLEVRQEEFLALMRRPDAPLNSLQLAASERVTANARMEVKPEVGSMLNFLIGEGLGEATNVLVIDEFLCVGCDNCEKACAETHGGVSRLDRKAGATFAQVHIPVACRHCEQPHCMKDCPPNAIRRSVTGEVFIDQTCIGCGNCEKNCPYDVIRMEYEAPPKPGLLRWLLTGAGPGPGEDKNRQAAPSAVGQRKKAMKCDACIDVPHGPACVKACPTGAAVRIGPQQIIDLVEEQKG